MNLSRNLMVGAALTGLLLSGCTSKVTEKEQYSGYLSNYDNLQEVSTPSGGTAMRAMPRSRATALACSPAAPPKAAHGKTGSIRPWRRRRRSR